MPQSKASLLLRLKCQHQLQKSGWRRKLQSKLSKSAPGALQQSASAVRMAGRASVASARPRLSAQRQSQPLLWRSLSRQLPAKKRQNPPLNSLWLLIPLRQQTVHKPLKSAPGASQQSACARRMTNGISAVSARHRLSASQQSQPLLCRKLSRQLPVKKRQNPPPNSQWHRSPLQRQIEPKALRSGLSA